MVNLNQFLQAISSEDVETREYAAKYLLVEFAKKPSDLPTNVLGFIAKRLNDNSPVVRRAIAVFLYRYAKSGRDLGQAWLNLAYNLRNEDVFVRKYIVESFGFLGPSENLLKSILDNPTISKDIKTVVAQALEHYYSRQKYFSSLGELLKREKPIVEGVISGLREDRSRGILHDRDFLSLGPLIVAAQRRLAQPKKLRPRMLKPRSRDSRYK